MDRRIFFFIALFVAVAVADPQTNRINFGCSQYNVTNATDFAFNLNLTLDDIRSAVAGDDQFFTASRPRAETPIYTLFQCRNYLSVGDCLACLAAAAAQIKRCGAAANGARVIFDGCFLRYESSTFFEQATQAGNANICNGSAGTAGFSASASELVRELSLATSRINGFFAAAESNGVYGVAQCVKSVSEDGCSQCLSVAYDNIKSCPPEIDGRAFDVGCFMRYSDKLFFPANMSMDLSNWLNSGQSSNKKAIIIGVVVGGFVSVLFVCLVVFLLMRRGKKSKKSGNILGATELQGPLILNYKDLKIATKNFSEETKIGEGGFGEVYKGLLKNGKTVAVKKLTILDNKRMRADFTSEVKLICNVHHRNLVRLLGCSSKGFDLLLVYEYMANGSLNDFLFGEKPGTLNWKQRYDIIVGIARGIAYLHHEFHACIIHRDIKTSNILLDDDFQPKIADFGLARLLPTDQSHLSTQFAGTLGYTAPEYAVHGQLSEKVDTYSFGVVVLEIISGRKCNDINREPATQYLLEWAWRLYEQNQLFQLTDDSLNPNEFTAEEITRIIEIGLLCTQPVSDRPTMSEVVVMLLSRGVEEFQPTTPTFIDAKSRIHGDASTSSATSRATISISRFSAR